MKGLLLLLEILKRLFKNLKKRNCKEKFMKWQKTCNT